MILILGGTSDCESIVSVLEQEKLKYIVSVATDYGAELVKRYAKKYSKGRLDRVKMEIFFKEYDIDLVIDATHPFANIVSENAIAATKKYGIQYIRFERPLFTKLEHVHYVTSIEEACDFSLKIEGTIYLTVGSKTTGEYVKNLPLERIISRVLPVSTVIKELEGLGLSAHNIEGLRGPFSKAVNKALLKKAEAGVLISKESGATGGLIEKRDACLELGIPCVVITRPKVIYPKQVSTIAELHEWLIRRK